MVKLIKIEDIRKALIARYPSNPVLLDEVVNIVNSFVEKKLHDNNIIQRLSSTDDNQYYQQLSEILFYKHLIENYIEFTPRPKADGPDFLIEKDGKKIWIELITPIHPDVEGLKKSVEKLNTDEIVILPASESVKIKEKYTSAIKEKCEKFEKYIKTGIISEQDFLIIAINYSLLDGFIDPSIGISGYPFVVEIAYGFNNQSINLESKQSCLFHRPEFQKSSNRSNIPQNIFYAENDSPINALWQFGMVLENLKLIDNFLVHNNLNNSALLPISFPVDKEYFIRENSSGERAIFCEAPAKFC